MSKTTYTLADFEAMTEEQKLELSAADLARLTKEKKEAEELAAEKAEAEAMKTKYTKSAPNGVFLLKVGDAKAWLKNMDRRLVSMVAAAGSDPVEAAELILENCWLEGDERIKTDDEYFLEAITQIQALRTSKIGSIKKF